MTATNQPERRDSTPPCGDSSHRHVGPCSLYAKPTTVVCDHDGSPHERDTHGVEPPFRGRCRAPRQPTPNGREASGG